MYSASIISLTAYLLVTITSIYYYSKFCFNYCYTKKYRYSLLDDINFKGHEVKSYNPINILDDSVALKVGDNSMDNENDAKKEEKTHYEEIDYMKKFDLEMYSEKFFKKLLWFMCIVIIFNVLIGFYVFVDIWLYNDTFDAVPIILFLISSYPFISCNICFIEIQLMNQLLHSTKIESSKLNSNNLLSSNSSFWFLFGYVINHFPILFFLIKTSLLIASYNATLYQIIYGYTNLSDNYWIETIFVIFIIILICSIMNHEQEFSDI